MCSNARGSGAFCDIVHHVVSVGCAFIAHHDGDQHGELSVKPGCKASGGEIRSENVDMSSDKGGERPPRRKSKGSCLKLI
jgi:hypothetical protein